MISTLKIVLISLLGLIYFCDNTTALKCASCLGPACANPSTATLQNCTVGAQDTCLVISVCGYAERTCGIQDQHCTVSAFKQNQYGAYSAMLNYCQTVNKQLLDSDLQSALKCCNSDNCNGATGKTATIAAVLICFGITFKLL